MVSTKPIGRLSQLSDLDEFRRELQQKGGIVGRIEAVGEQHVNAEDQSSKHVHAKEGQGAWAGHAVFEDFFTCDEAIFIPQTIICGDLFFGLLCWFCGHFFGHFFGCLFLAHARSSTLYVTR